ncbi:MAG: transcriptional repressor [Clostridia bacterium]|nr:transcriptional repressor [Clostridia bacterium]
MSTTGEYRTRQRAAILQYFKSHPHAHLTAEELCEALHADGISVGKSTVYRALDKLAEAGTVRRFTIAPGEGACYQYAGSDRSTCHAHFHLKCLVCGTLYHIECEHLDELTSHLGAQHNFTVDYAKTVLYGTCDPCRRALSAVGTKNES